MLVRVLILCLFTYQVQAELYRCTGANGKIQYTDQACPESGASYQPKAVMTNYKTIKPFKIHSKKSSTRPKTQNQPCPFFSSTELRNLRVKGEFKKGLTTKDIEKRLGKADDIRHDNDKSIWQYHNKNVKRLFRFKHNCLTGWKEKWSKNVSKVNKMRESK